MSDLDKTNESLEEELEENATDLIKKLGIPHSTEEMEYILKEGKKTRDNYLFTYASMLCEQTPQGNEYVDELIALSVQNCEAEHIPRLIRDYESGAKGIHSAAERGYNRNPNISGISFGRFAGVKNTYGQMPLNFERRKRVMLAIYRGMIKNPNIEIDQLRIFIDTYNFDENDPVAENFIENQFDELQIALQTGECKFTIKELLERSKKRFGISAEELEKRLDDAESRLTDKSKEMITNITNRRRQVLKEIVNGDRKYDSMKLTTKDLETILELYLVDEKKDGKTIRETGMIPSTIRNMPEFKNIVIDYAKNNPPNERMRNLLFSPISSVLDEGIFEDKEFMEKVKEDYGEDSSARISEAIYYKMRHELDDKDFLAKKLDFIEELVEQTNDVGILQGILHIIDKENLQNSDFVDRIFSISTDLETISIIVDKAHRSAFKNPEFLNTILAQTTDQKVIEEVLSRMTAEDKMNPEIMLGIIENCPNVLEVFEEKYDNWEGRSNLFYKLTSNEEFQKGLFNIIQSRIQQSEITTRYKEERFESIRRYL